MVDELDSGTMQPAYLRVLSDLYERAAHDAGQSVVVFDTLAANILGFSLFLGLFTLITSLRWCVMQVLASPILVGWWRLHASVFQSG